MSNFLTDNAVGQFIDQTFFKGTAARNEAAVEAEKTATKYQNRQADEINEYNDKLDARDIANANITRKFDDKTRIDNWKQGELIKDFNHLSTLKQYEKSLTIGIEQLGLNAKAESQGIDAEMDAINEAFLKYHFDQRNNLSTLKEVYADQNIARQEQGVKLAGIKSKQMLGAMSVQNTVDQMLTQSAIQKESAMVRSLIEQGQTQLGQAGRSTAKAQQANIAGLQRGLRALDIELAGKRKQAAIQLADLNVDASLEEMGVGLNLQRIDNAVKNAENTARDNSEILGANLKSLISQAESNIEQIQLEREISDVNTRAGIMIKPQRVPASPRPKKLPKLEFVERMEVRPGYVQPAQQESLFGAFVQNTRETAAMLLGGGGGGGGGTPPTTPSGGGSYSSPSSFDASNLFSNTTPNTTGFN